MKLYKKEWDDLMLLDHEGDVYQLNDRDDLFHTLLHILAPEVEGAIETLDAQEFWRKLND